MSAQVVILGGGPAGLAAAIAAAQAGFSVLVAEPCFPPTLSASRADRLALPSSIGMDADAPADCGAIDKCCGEGLLPPALAALSALGLSPALLGAYGYPLAGIRFHTARRHAAATFAAGTGLGMRRTTLHTLLMDRARELGVEHVARAGRLQAAGVQIGQHHHTPQWVIGADGAGSAARIAAGLDGGRVASRRFAVRQHFALAPGSPTPSSVEVHWARGAQAYGTPVGPGRVGIAVLSRERVAGMPAALALFPALADSLHGAVPVSRPRGAVTVHRTLRSVYRGNFALVGDAAGGVDAITGDGLALAFQQAVALGGALQGGDLEAYGRAHGRLLRPARLMSRALLAMGSCPAGTAACMALLGQMPGVFNGLLRMHARSANQAPYTAEAAPWQAART